MASRTPISPVASLVLPRDIVAEIEEDFINYSMSVIVQRALPDARDGLKPVQRRILRAMADQSLWPDAKYKKSATVVGDVLGKYHPHGDSSVYDAMVRMEQGHAMHEPLVDGQGNFGTIDDSAAAYRYTEARMTGLAELMLRDIDKQTVDFSPNFDGRLKEPVVLPAGLPNLLLNGSEGIAVGMATKIPPHNLRELVAALELLLDDPRVDDKLLMSKVKGPDFPTGGFLLTSSEIKELQATGRGKMYLRARCAVEKVSSGRMAIVVTELPYSVSPEKLATDIQKLVRDNAQVPGGDRSWGDAVAALRNESDREGLRVVIEVKRDVEPAMVLAALYQKTDLQTTYAAQVIALVKKRPTYLGLRVALEVYIEHRVEVLVRRCRYELEKAEARVHIIEGLLIAISAIDRVVAIIKKSKDRATAKEGLIKAFRLSQLQADAILSMRLAQLTSLDVTDLKDERNKLVKEITELKRILASPKRQREVIKQELLEAAKPFYRPRRTELLSEKAVGPSSKEGKGGPTLTVSLSETEMEVGLLADGTIRAFAGKRRGEIVCSKSLKSTEHLVVVTSSGRGWPLTLARLGGATSRGVGIEMLLSGLEPGERVLTLIGPEDQSAEDRSLVFVYKNGKVKRLAMADLAEPKSVGTPGVKLNDGDVLLTCLVASGTDTILLASNAGKVLRLPIEGLPIQGRAANGVAGMKVAEDVVVSATVLTKGVPVGILTGLGSGKVVPESDFPIQGRGGQGVWLVRVSEKTGEVVWAGALGKEERLLANETVVEVKSLAKGDRAMAVKPVKDLGGLERGAIHVIAAE